MSYHHEGDQLVKTKLNRFKVKVVGYRQRITVEAEYMRVDAGVLWFRTYQRNGYPLMVRCFAAGMWQDVEADHEAA